MSLHRYSGAFQPAEVDLLQRVFDKLCDKRFLAKDGDERDSLALEIISAFRNGITDEDELLQTLSTLR